MIAIAGASAGASAETVYIRSGQSEGQGWLFRDSTGCWVATAGHVIRDDGPRVNAIVIGANGDRGEADMIVRDTDHDVALIRLIGTLARTCPGSVIGDRDVKPMLDRALQDGIPIHVERREARAGSADLSYGVESVPLVLAGVSEASPIFTMHIGRTRDTIYAADSGAPIRFQGKDFDEAGLPLGIVTHIDAAASPPAIVAVRIDAIRAFFEARVSNSTSRVPHTSAFDIIGFTGDTPDTSCGPINLTAEPVRCGWRAHGSRQAPIGVTLDLGAVLTITAIRAQFKPGSLPKGITVFTTSNLALTSAWSGGRYCNVPRSGYVLCSLGQRDVRGIRISVDAIRTELTHIDVVTSTKRDGL
jgi:hypothetical protein